MLKDDDEENSVSADIGSGSAYPRRNDTGTQQTRLARRLQKPVFNDWSRMEGEGNGNEEESDEGSSSHEDETGSESGADGLE